MYPVFQVLIDEPTSKYINVSSIQGIQFSCKDIRPSIPASGYSGIYLVSLG